MVDNYNQIERARNLLYIDETDEKYYSLLFVALRCVGITMKESITIIRGELKNTDIQISYHDIYRDISMLAQIFQEGGTHEVKVPAEELVQKLESKSQRPPKGTLGHLVWIETITRSPESEREFKKVLKVVRNEIVNPTGG